MARARRAKVKANAKAKPEAQAKAKPKAKPAPVRKAKVATRKRTPKTRVSHLATPAADAFDPTAALGTAAHEIKNGLGPLAMTLQLAERKALAGEPVPLRDLAFARAQVGRLARLVNDLLDVTSADTDQLPMRPRSADLAATVEEAIDIFERGNVRQVARALPGSPVMMTFDPDRILQVLLNLLENAAKYAPLPAPLSLTLTHFGDHARVEVRDGGPGISEEDQRRVFDRFTRARDTDDDTRGLGLGLYLCRAIIERSGGRIGVESAPGQGAVFWFEVFGSSLPPYTDHPRLDR